MELMDSLKMGKGVLSLVHSVFLLISLIAFQSSALAATESKKSAKKRLPGCLGLSATALNQRAAPFQSIIQANAKRYGVDENLIKAVIAVESCYQVKARSHANAQGLMQLIPATAERFGVTNPYSSQQNIRGGTRYLSWLLKRFRGDMTKALAGYNAGEGAVDKYRGVPPYRETQFYVKHVTMLYKRLGGKAPASVVDSLPIVAQSEPVRYVDGMAITAGRIKVLPADVKARQLAQARARQAAQNRQQAQGMRVQRAVYRGGAQAQKAALLRGGVGVRGGQVTHRPAKPRRVAHTYSVAKPGRAGLQANKARAPHLYKH